MISASSPRTAVVFFVAAVLFSYVVGANVPPVVHDPCSRAFRACDFRFESPTAIPFLQLSAHPDRAVTPRIVSKNRHEILGVLNSNNVPAQVIKSHTFIPIDKLFSTPPLTPTHIKPYHIPHTTGSGVGFQTLTGSQRDALTGLCVRLFFTHYQVLDKFGNVKTNRNDVPLSEKKCVVFRTI